MYGTKNFFLDHQIKSAHSGYRDQAIGIMSIENKSSQLSRWAGKEGVQKDLRNTLIVKIVHNIFKRLKFMFYRQCFSLLSILLSYLEPRQN